MHLLVPAHTLTPAKPFCCSSFCFNACRSAGSPSAGPYPCTPATPAATSCAATSNAAGGGCQCTMPCARDMTCLLGGARAISCFVLTMTGGSVARTRLESCVWDGMGWSEVHGRAGGRSESRPQALHAVSAMSARATAHCEMCVE
jgi:hypothetical protein